MSEFDAAAAVAQFWADESQTFLKMPHMTNGQRKHAKKVLDDYPDIRCESYGFGPERTLHLFKAGETAMKANGMRRASPLAISCNRVRGPLSDGNALGLVDPEGIEDALDDRPELILPLTSQNLQVRNTFIHIGDASPDDRAVKSMPHGMFKQCLLSEAAQEETFFCNTPTSAGGDSPSFAESEAELEDLDMTSLLKIGAVVRVEGLVKLPSYNGQLAVVDSWDETTARYTVQIMHMTGSLQAKVKRENLRLVVPCPR